MSRDRLIQRHGGYRRLKSFELAQLVYDLTVRFCERYVDKRSRTRDQMVQAARSGVQNIAEGSQASGTSRKMELKLTNVARASLEELKLDYQDFLRQRGLAPWPDGAPLRWELVQRRPRSVGDVADWVGEVHARNLRHGPNGRSRPDGLNGRDGRNGRDESGGMEPGSSGALQAPADGQSTPSIVSMPSISSMPPSMRPLCYPEIAANAALVLIGVACALLDRQIAAQAARFEREGGFTERLYRIRQERRRGG